jgi:hypothetical protein
MIHKKSTEKVWVDGLGYCVEVKHYNELGKYEYKSYTPIERG